MSKSIPFSVKRRQDVFDGKCTVETKEGQKVNIICWDRKNPNGRIVGLVGDEEKIYTWDKNGKHFMSENPKNDLVLISHIHDVPQDEFWKTLDKFTEDYALCTGNCVKVIDEYYLKLMTIAKKMFSEKETEDD